MNNIDDQEEDYDEIFDEDDEWEDQKALEHIRSQMPENWKLVKLINFTSQTLIDMDEWLIDNAQRDYKRVGWNTDCQHMVAVQFEDDLDAIFFKLRWI